MRKQGWHRPSTLGILGFIIEKWAQRLSAMARSKGQIEFIEKRTGMETLRQQLTSGTQAEQEKLGEPEDQDLWSKENDPSAEPQ